jgi:hypothetical protein
VFENCPVRISSRTPASLTEVLRGFLQPLQENSGIISCFYHNHYLPDSFLFIIHLSSYHPTLHNLDAETIVKHSTKYCISLCFLVLIRNTHTHSFSKMRKSWSTLLIFKNEPTKGGLMRSHCSLYMCLS